MRHSAAWMIAEEICAFNAAPPISPPSMSAGPAVRAHCPASCCRRTKSARLRRRRILRRQLRAQAGVHFLRHFRRRGLAGADRPHRLVGDHDLSPPRRGQQFQHRAQLGADHWSKVCPASRCASVSPTQTIGVMPSASTATPSSPPARCSRVVGAALGVADDHVAAAEVGQHASPHFAGVGAAWRWPTHPARPRRPGCLQRLLALAR
jgi:hypothetical protein